MTSGKGSGPHGHDHDGHAATGRGGDGRQGLPADGWHDGSHQTSQDGDHHGDHDRDHDHGHDGGKHPVHADDHHHHDHNHEDEHHGHSHSDDDRGGRGDDDDCGDGAGGGGTGSGARDGIVEGSDQGELIDAAYDGDPDGDFVDANDAILPGVGPNDDVIFAYGGDDVIKAGAGDDVVFAGEGDDLIIGGRGDDVLFGEEGDDRFILVGGDDIAIGGEGDDSFVIRGTGDTIVVGGEDEDGKDWDTLDPTAGLGKAYADYEIIYNEADETGESGVIRYFDAGGNQVGSTNFSEIEKVYGGDPEPPICFTPGTMIATPRGEVPAERLRPGDQVITRDNGIREIAWTGARTLDWRALASQSHMMPILVKAGALGGGLPERDTMLSPNHRVLVAGDRTQLYFEEREVLAAAKHLVDHKGIVPVEAAMGVTYIHFMCEQHEVVLSNGAWTETFQPGDYSLKGLGNAQRTEIFELFPDLETVEGLEAYAAARRSLKKHEARLLVRG